MEFLTNDGKRAENFSVSNNNVGIMEHQLPINFFPILQLPTSMLMNILSILPIKTVITCRSVCKKFLYIISDPYFAKLHLSRSSIGILIKTIPKKNQSKRLYSAQIFNNGSPALQVEKLKFTLESNFPSCDIVNGCNGFLCLYGNKEGIVYVCNPILGEYITISPPCRGRFSSFVRLGYSETTGQYKVIQTVHQSLESSSSPENIQLHAFVYTIGTGVWRSIGKVPCDLYNVPFSSRFDRCPFNSFLNGCIHWLHDDKPENNKLIWSFNFDTEQFKPVSLPSDFSELAALTDVLTLGVLQECLYMCFFGNGQLDIWVMKEYGVQESWSKKFVIQNYLPETKSYHIYEPMFILKNKEIFMHYKRKAIVSYSPGIKFMGKRRIFGTHASFDAFAYTPCFVSLFHIAKGEESKITRIRGTGEGKKLLTEEFYNNFAGYGVEVEPSVTQPRV